MNENKAYMIATGLDADMLRLNDGSGYAVGVITSNDKYAVFQDTSGWLFADEVTCFATDIGEAVESEWDTWGFGEQWAIALATLIGGQAHHRRGTAWEVLLQRGDGKFAVISSDEVEVYQSRGHYDACGKPEYHGWDW